MFFCDCGLFACVFAEFITNGCFKVPSQNINAKFYRQIYGALHWEYATSKHTEDTITESEVTRMAAIELNGSSTKKEVVQIVVQDC